MKECSHTSRFLKAKKFLNEGCHFISSVLNVCVIEGCLIYCLESFAWGGALEQLKVSWSVSCILCSVC